MDSKERVMSSLAFERPDRIAIDDGFWEEFEAGWRRKAGNTGNIYDVYKMDVAVHVCDESFFPKTAGLIRKEGDYEISNDGWGRTVRTRPGTVFSETIESVIKGPEDVDKLEFDSPLPESRYERFDERVKKDIALKKAVFVKTGGPFIRSTFIRGEADFLMDLVGDEGLAKALVEKVAAHLLAIGLEELRRTGLYDTGVWIYDDMAANNGPMFSPGTFKNVFLPVYKKLVSGLKKAGAKKVILHSDGNILPVLDMLVEAGIDGINPVEPKAGMDLVKIKKQYGRKLALIGGVDNAFMLPRGDKKEIEKHVMPIIEAGKDGGVIIGAHSIGPDVSVETYDFYYNLVMKKGSY
jgi:uroporphyrinogen decarboxylase